MTDAVATPLAPPPAQQVHLLGVRHHGPGSARSVLQALHELQPDCVLVEGPPEAQDLLQHVLQEGMQPPVALLSYCPDDAALAVYHPFAEFSPEWQALVWTQQRGVALRWMDLPLVHGMALEQARQREAALALQAQIDAALGAQADAKAETVAPAPTTPDVEGTEPTATAEVAPTDPLHWLAQAAGYNDGESWWNHQVEERTNAFELFAAIGLAMTTLRQEAPPRPESAFDQQRETLREAHMRQTLRQTQKDGFERIAVVCGAWHVPALRLDGKGAPTAKADQSLLKGLAKLKVQTTWVPWTLRHLTRASGYGAGIHSPGWYSHLWQHTQVRSRTVGWLTKVAHLLRSKDLDCSSASLIEAARLSDTLASLRGRPAPGLDELQEAVRTVLTQGEESVMALIHDQLIVNDQLGSVPATVPVVPLQRDLEQTQKTLRLKPEATQRTLDLDLRQANDLARSQLLHRLLLLDLPWGELARVGKSSKGSFHEVWTLQWQPEFALRLIEASVWGHSLLQACTAKALDDARQTSHLGELAGQIDGALLANLEDAVQALTQRLADCAATSGDATQLLAALPPLANVYRYGNVRQTDAGLVAQVLDGLIVRAAISLPLACQGLNDDAATALRPLVLKAHQAVKLRQGDEQTQSWQRALALLGASTNAHSLLVGVATRLGLDDGWLDIEQVAQAMSLHLSQGSEPPKAAAWLDGFLNENALVLLQDAKVWALVDQWLTGLAEEHFTNVLPLVRRSFANFSASERRELGFKASHGVKAVPVVNAVAWDAHRAERVIPTLRSIWGLEPTGVSA